MKSTIAVELIANAGKMTSEMTRAGGSVSRFSAGVRKEFDAIKRAAGSIQGQLAGLGITVGLVALTKQSAQLDKEITRVGQTASGTKDQVGGLRRELFLMAKQSGGEVEGLKQGFDSLIQSGQSWKASLESINAINIAKGVTGAQESVLAAGLSVGGVAFQIDLEKPGKALELLDKMTVAGRLGNAELEDLSNIFSRVGGNAAAAGLKFENTLGFVEALSMIERNPERLATLADSTLRVFTNNNYMKAAQKATGIKFFDAKGSRRDATAVLGDIKRVYDTLKTDEQRNNFVSKAFGGADLDTVKGLRTLLTGNNLANIDIMTGKIVDASGTLRRDFDAATRNLIDQSGRLKTTLREAADGFASPIKDALSSGIKKVLTPKEQGGYGQTGASLIAGAGLAVGTAAIVARFGGSIGGLASKLLGKTGNLGAGVAAGKALEAAAGVTPVFVTNMPEGGLTGTPSAAADVITAAGGGTASSLLTRLGLGGLTATVGAASAAAIAGTVAAGGAIGYGAGTLANNYLIDGTKFGDLIGLLGNLALSPFSESSRQAIEINMQIDQQGRVVTTSDDTQTKVNAKTKRGEFK